MSDGPLFDLVRSIAPAVVRPRRRSLNHDYETWSEVNLKEVGLSRYLRHPSTEILMLAYSFDERDDIRQWIPAEDGSDPPAEFMDALQDERIQKTAWNAQFEHEVAKLVLGVDTPYEAWRCTMVLAMSLCLPGSLGQCGEVVGVPEDRKKALRGKLLLRKFTGPRKPTKTKPWTRSNHLTDWEDWCEFVQYNRQDVVAEIAMKRRLRRWDMPPQEWEMWAIDQKINAAGIPVNLDMVRNVVRIVDELTEDRIVRMREVTGLANPNSNAQLLPWLQDNGYVYSDLKKGHVLRGMDEALEAGRKDLARVLEWKSEVARTSIKKYREILACTDDDGNLRYQFQFAGAGRTWRWSGRGVQVHNLTRPTPEFSKPEQQITVATDLETFTALDLDTIYPKPFDALASAIRPSFQAPPGKLFVDADLNAIENRVLGWMAQDHKILEVFEKNRDPYIDFARYLYGTTYDVELALYEGGDKSHRTIAKPGVLGCGYMLSAGNSYEDSKTGEIVGTGLIGYALNMGVKLTQQEAEKSVRVWREQFEKAVDFWFRVEKAMRRCILKGSPTECWPVRFDLSGPFCRMILPSGRALHYLRPRIEPCVMPWGGVKNSITYEGKEDGRYQRIQTHPGKITENADQAISRDLLAHGIRLARDEGIDVRIHMHDQIAGLVVDEEAEKMLPTLIECMSVRPEWAAGLPLGAAGTISKYFVKD